MGNELDLTKYLSDLAGWVWVAPVIEKALARPWVPVFLLGVLGAVLLGRAYWTLHRSTAIPVVRAFILIGYLLVALLLLDVTAALWQVQEPSEVVRALGGFCPMSRWPLHSWHLWGSSGQSRAFCPDPGRLRPSELRAVQPRRRR